jgi:hypothetical protein
MDRILTDGPANLALEFLQTRHALSVERWLRKKTGSAKTSIAASDRGGPFPALPCGYVPVIPCVPVVRILF